MAEHVICNLEVIGSIPIEGSSLHSSLSWIKHSSGWKEFGSRPKGGGEKIVRVGEVVSQQTHNLQGSGSSPLPATKTKHRNNSDNKLKIDSNCEGELVNPRLKIWKRWK